MNKRSRKTKGLSHRLIALLLCCVCLLAAMPAGAVAADAAPSVEESVAEQQVSNVQEAQESAAPAEPEVSTEPSAEPTVEPTVEPAEPTAEPSAKSKADELFDRLMACTSYEAMEAAINAPTEEEQALMKQFTEEQETALQTKMNELSGNSVATLENLQYTITQGGNKTVSIDNMGSKFAYECNQTGITASLTSAWWGNSGYKISVGNSVPAGTYTLTVNYETTSWDWNHWKQTTTQHTDTVTITVTEAGTEDAQVFYLKTPTSDPDSNDTDQWGRNIGNGTVKTNGATWTKNKNVFNPGAYVTGMPKDMVKQADGSWFLPKNDTYSQDYTTIFDAYKKELEKDLGVTLASVDDIEAIYLIPYKISKDNGSTPDKHIDCKISIKTKNVYAALFWVTLPDGTQKQVDAKNYKIENRVEKTTKAPTEENGNYPETIEEEDGTYQFVGWYNEAGELIEESGWAYTPSDTELADGTVNFYARYERAYANLTIKKTLSGNMYNENDKFEFTVRCGEDTQTYLLGNGDIQTISIPVGAAVTVTENAGSYTYSLTSISLDDSDYTGRDNGVSFTMPRDAVSVEINNAKNITIDTGVVLDKLPYILILVIVAAGIVAVSRRRKSRAED